MFQRFERLLHPYPDALPPAPPRRFFAFLWEGSRGVRRYLLVVTLATAGIGAFEALLFSMMAHVVDALAQTRPAELWPIFDTSSPRVLRKSLIRIAARSVSSNL